MILLVEIYSIISFLEKRRKPVWWVRNIVIEQIDLEYILNDNFSIYINEI